MTSDTTKTPPKPENMWLNLLFNIVIPALILSKLSSEDRLGPIGALVVGLAFPLVYGTYDLIARKKWNLFSILGVASVSLTGGLGLMEADGVWFAVKEAAVPLMFAVAVLATLKTPKPLVRALILNDSVVDVPRIEAALDEKCTRPQFDKLLESSTWLLAGSLGLSAVLNFALARVVLKSPAGTPEFTAELGKMTWMSYPVIVVPSMAIMIYILMRLFKGIHHLTGLGLEDIAHKKHEKK
jgi:hypothetical protein